MKIGILTFHCACNYGAVLQTYGLQEYLKSCGHDVEIIDYRPSYLTAGGYWAFPLPQLKKASLFRKILRIGNWIRLLPLRIASLSARIKFQKGFTDFINRSLFLTRESYVEGDCIAVENFDALVFGSDQIWSPIHTNGGDLVFWGDLPNSNGKLKIAYAASAGASSEQLGENPIFVAALKNFDAISVRESNLAASLQPKTELKIETVLDPTLLVDKSIWEKLAVPPKMQKKYVLVYQVSYNPQADRIAREIAKQLECDIVSVWAGFTPRRKGMHKSVSPTQFVGWVRNATFVISTSFHGTAFSLIFEKPFYYVGNGNAAENRPRQILGSLGLSNRYIVGTHGSSVSTEIDWCDVRERLLRLRGHSHAFLNHSLSIKASAS